MGDGILTLNDADPCDEWAMRINNLVSPQLSQHLRNFLGGEPVVSSASLEVSVADLADPNSHKFTLRRNGAPYVADVLVEAKAATEITAVEPDQRSSLPSPTSWLVSADPEPTTWELYNCVVLSVQSRSNTP